MGRISPLIQTSTGDLHIGSSFDIPMCGTRDAGRYVGKGSISTATRESTLSALRLSGSSPGRLCRLCFTESVRTAFARERA
jgi:hypothetical protein